MSSDEISPVEFGRLLEGVESLTEEVRTLRIEVAAIKQTMAGSKGVVIGMLIAAGGLGAGITKVVDHIFK